MYNDKRWHNLRTRVLKRDGYQCKECLRYGRVTQANTVHHIKPVDGKPELYLNSKNCLSLCAECHNKMHDRETDELTDTGLRWVKRVWGTT